MLSVKTLRKRGRVDAKTKSDYIVTDVSHGKDINLKPAVERGAGTQLIQADYSRRHGVSTGQNRSVRVTQWKGTSWTGRARELSGATGQRWF